MGGLSAMAFAGINGHYARIAKTAGGLSPAEWAERALATGAAGGVMASIQGQRFGNAFASAGLGSALSPAGEYVGGNAYAQGFVAAIVGGTVSEATGGKFANGAVTAAFAFAVGRVVPRGSAAPSDNQLIPLEEARAGTWPSAQVATDNLAQLRFAMGWLHDQGLLDPQFNFAFEAPGLLDFQYNDVVKKHPFAPGFALGAEAPLDGSPIQFYRSGVSYNMIATFRTFAHEVLHRNPLLAALYRSQGDPAAVHVRMLTPVQSAQDAYRHNQSSIERAWEQR